MIADEVSVSWLLLSWSFLTYLKTGWVSVLVSQSFMFHAEMLGEKIRRL